MAEDRMNVAVLTQLSLTRFLSVFNATAFLTLALMVSFSFPGTYFDVSSVTAKIILSYVLPFLLLPGVVGYLCDRFSKRDILVWSKLAEMAVMLVGVYYLKGIGSGDESGFRPLYVILFFLGVRKFMSRVAFQGYLPELTVARRLGRINGVITGVSFIACASGVLSGYWMAVLVRTYAEVDIALCGWLFFALAFLACVISFHLPSVSAAAPRLCWRWRRLAGFADAFSYPAKAREFGFSIAAESGFFVYAAYIQLLLLLYVRDFNERYEGFGALSGVLLFCSPLLGALFGGLISGRFSSRKLEFGQVSFGALAMVVSPLLMDMLASPAVMRGFDIVPMSAAGMLAGIGAVVFVLPMRQFKQEHAPADRRGEFYADGSALYALAFICTALFMFVMAVCLHMSAAVLGLLLGGFTLLMAVYVHCVNPELAFRFAAMVLTNSLYRLRTSGEERIPSNGAALLVANHVSFIDALFISACTERKVYFMMHEDYYNLPLLHSFARWARFIKVPAPQKPKQMQELFAKVRGLLEDGNIVCVFPEGGISSNGIMQGFKSSTRQLLPAEGGVPVIPVRLGMVWGPMLSFQGGRLRFTMPRELPIPVSLTVGAPVSPMLGAYELRQTLSELAADTEMTRRDKEFTLHHHFARRVRRHPFQRTYKDFEGVELSNFSFLVRSLLLSRKIRNIVGDDCEHVGIMLPGCVANAVTIMAVLFADKIPAILNFTASKSTIDAAVGKAGITHVLTSRKFIQKAGIAPSEQMVFLEDVAAGIGTAEKFTVSMAAALLPSRELMNMFAPKRYDDVFSTAVVLFSSGSTGDPKGVMLSHHNINSDFFSFWRAVGCSGRDKVVGNLPLFHSFGFTVCFWLPALTGVEVIFIPNPLDAAAVLRLARHHRATLMVATPTFLQAYMRKGSAEDFSSLRLVVTGAEKLRRDIAEKFHELTGLSLIEGYGCTELSPIVSINLPRSIFDSGRESGPLGSIGVPMPGICVKIADPETGEALPADTEGMIMVKGPTVMKGYLNDPNGTAAVIRDGWYRTGDVGRMSWDGYLYITGRLSRFSKISGEMVPHEMIEVAISEIVGSEDRCVAVCGKSDRRKGERLVVLYSKEDVDPNAVVEALRRRGITNLWIPRPDDFIRVEKIPMLGSGKLDLKRLKEMAEDSC